jgi:3-hydroxymyristoyl/3-hydroxydecanoyl-(acyl carrier protein) dehydratase
MAAFSPVTSTLVEAIRPQPRRPAGRNDPGHDGGGKRGPAAPLGVTRASVSDSLAPFPMNEPVYVRADLAAVYLPVGPMLQIDRVLEVTADTIRCEMDLERHWVFPLHFPGDPIFPACLMIEAAGQAIAIWAFHHKVAGQPRLARVDASFSSGVRPGDGVLSFVGRVRRRRNICVGTVQLFVGERPVAEVGETLAWVA